MLILFPNAEHCEQFKHSVVFIRSVETVHFVVGKCPAAKEAAARIQKKNKQKIWKIVWKEGPKVMLSGGAAGGVAKQSWWLKGKRQKTEGKPEVLCSMCRANSIVLVVIRLNPVTDTGHYLIPSPIIPSIFLFLVLPFSFFFCFFWEGWGRGRCPLVGHSFFVKLSAARAAQPPPASLHHPLPLAPCHLPLGSAAMWQFTQSSGQWRTDQKGGMLAHSLRLFVFWLWQFTTAAPPLPTTCHLPPPHATCHLPLATPTVWAKITPFNILTLC